MLACLTSQQHASVSQGRICSDTFKCCHTETEVADQTFYLTQSQHTNTGPTSPSTDPTMPGAWQGSHWSANFQVTGMTRPEKIPSQAGFEPRSSAPEADTLTTRPARRSSQETGKRVTLYSFSRKAGPSNCSRYREITMLSLPGTILATVILERINKQYQDKLLA